MESNLNASAPNLIPEGQAEASTPVNLEQQIASLQKQLRDVRAHKDRLAERQAVLEGSLTGLFARLGLAKKINKMHESLNEEEKKLLKEQLGKPAS